ncbi:hypothetical protein TPR58_22070 [Sphingomonas sp. HF-S3]|uniref:Uncharacterized protein n=1 Tax=Sphingomonas rustica TaxID=3103142 RepID=A0ABV0BIG2_9SPHN
MNRFAAQLVELAVAHFPPALLDEAGSGAGAAALRRSAAWLAPGVQLYFECRLAGGDRAIDVSQHFFAARGGVTALSALAQARAALPGTDLAWARLADFASGWATEPAIVEIGLEHDAGPDGWIAAPAVFAAFDRGALADRDAGERFVTAVAPHAGQAWSRLVDTLARAEALGMASGRLVGAMLSRDAQLRCMIRGVAPEPVAALLREIGWPGDPAPLIDLLGWPELGGDATRLVLGFAPGPVAECGIEVIHPQGAGGDAARAALLDRLAAAGLAERPRVAALAEWPATITPIDARADWPDAMIAADLAHGGASYCAGFVNHVKLNLAGGRVLPAKAYLALAPMLQGSGHA